MAVYSRHPVRPAPSAPARASTGHLLLRAYTTLLLFIALATTFWFNALGAVGLGILLVATTILSLALWIWLRPILDVRRLPWFVLAYIVWAGASLIWTHWTGATLLTWGLLIITTIQGLFVASVLTWRELVGAITSALIWVVGLSLAFEAWVWFVIGHPILPNFLAWDGEVVKELYWSRANLFDMDARIQGIVGNAHLMAIAALLALITLGIRLASQRNRRTWTIIWIVVSLFLLWRSASATVYLAAAAVVLVLATILTMRTTRRPGERTKWYLLFAGLGAALAALAVFGQDLILGALGKSSDLTERTRIWSSVWERIQEHPVIGWGYSTPWVPWDPSFSQWIIVNDLPVFHAHNMWLDVLFQLGWIGAVILLLAYLSYIWHAWFFAVDRPRWDLDAHRPYQALTVLPTLIATVLLVQGLAESRPLMEWGWMFLVMFSSKMARSPLVGEGPAEQRIAMERGDRIDPASRSRHSRSTTTS